MLLTNRRLPAYPLLVKDPFFSFWLAGDDPANTDVSFWHGEVKPIKGTVTVDGEVYRFLGTGSEKPLMLTGTSVNAFSTEYKFTGPNFVLRVEFFSPLLPNDLDILSLPVAYVEYTFESDAPHDVSLTLAVEERACYNTCFDDDGKADTRVNKFVLNGCECAGIGLLRQMPLSCSFDENGADWGYYYVAGKTAGSYEQNDRKWIYAKNAHGKTMRASDCFAVAFDDIVSIFYFGEYLKNYWQRGGKTVFDAIEYALAHRAEIHGKCAEFDKKLVDMAQCFSSDYLLVLYASVRQSVAAHKLVADGKGRVLFLSKECNSDGCIATVDISYPSAPMYLLFNPELVKGMLQPILDFARMPVWKYDFAPHDAGIYPYCSGQYYGIKYAGKDECTDLAVHDWKKPELLPFYYQYPKNHELYVHERQMPVEESGNMLVLAWLYYAVSGDKGFLSENYDLFCSWVKYLIDFGLIPDNQLCTDDFAGHLDKNANLAVKAIVGIDCFARIAGVLGKNAERERYAAEAESYAASWEELYNDGDHTVLTQGNMSSFSLKYNMAVDVLLGGRLFGKLVARELTYYETKANKYGVPLDSRNSYTKTDWLMWVAAMGDNATVDRYARFICDFMTDTPDRVPFPDWIDSEKPKYYSFRNRTVQSGNFFPLLVKYWSEICKEK